jgi:hypothetical protein
VLTDKYYPVLNRKFQKPLNSLEAGAFFLGLLWGTSLHRDSVPKGSTCISRGCPFPAVQEGKCRRHATFFEYMESMEGRDFDYDDLYASEDNPEPRFSTMAGYELDYSYRQTKFIYRGVFDHKSKLADSYLGEK